MKKTTSIILSLLIFVLSGLTALAATSQGKAYFSGQTEVSANSTITVTFTVSQVEKMTNASGTVTFDSKYLTFVKSSSAMSNPWVVQVVNTGAGLNFSAADNTRKSFRSGDVGLFSLTFNVKDLPKGTKIPLVCKSIKITDNISTVISDFTYYLTIPLPVPSPKPSPQPPAPSAQPSASSGASAVTSDASSPAIPGIDSSSPEVSSVPESSSSQGFMEPESIEPISEEPDSASSEAPPESSEEAVVQSGIITSVEPKPLLSTIRWGPLVIVAVFGILLFVFGSITGFMLRKKK